MGALERAIGSTLASVTQLSFLFLLTLPDQQRVCENELPWRRYGFDETFIFRIKIKHLVSGPPPSYLRQVSGFS